MDNCVHILAAKVHHMAKLASIGASQYRDLAAKSGSKPKSYGRYSGESQSNGGTAKTGAGHDGGIKEIRPIRADERTVRRP